MPCKPRPVIDRILSKVDVSETRCWEWTGATTRSGYGNALGSTPGSRVYVHRYVYEFYVGPIPEGHEIDHLCQNPRCIRPDHLEAVTPEENRRRVTERRTHCPHGHPFDEQNTYWWHGHRYCRTCRLARIAQTRQRVKEAL